MLLDRILQCLICLYIITLPWADNKFELGKKFTSIVLALILMLYLLRIMISYENRRKFVSNVRDFLTDYLSIFMCALMAIMLISVTYAVERKLALSESVRFLSYVVLFFMIKYDFNLKEYTNSMIKSYIFTTSFLCIFGVYQYFTGFGLDESFKNYEYAKVKVAATMDNPNNLAAFLILAIFPIIMLAITEKVKTKKLYYCFISILAFINLILTGSRNAMIGIIIGLGMLVILYNRKLIVFLIGFGAMGLLVPEIRSRLLAITDKTQNQSREYLWQIAKKMIKDHPLRGVGNGNYVSLYDKYTDMYPEYKFYNYHRFPCHNSYLKVESELGIIGGVSFIGILVSALLKVRMFIVSTKDETYKFFFTGFLASMVAFYFMNLFDNLFFVPKTTTYFWILLAISQGAMFNLRNRRIS